MSPDSRPVAGEAASPRRTQALLASNGVLVSVSLPVASPSLPDSAPVYPRLEITDLFRIADWCDRLVWTPFQEGIDIHRLHGDGRSGSTAALLRFRQAGKVPLHHHTGWEHILVLAGRQHDQNGSSGAGTLMINPPGTTHSVVGEAGCIVLAIYEHPVEFLATPPGA